MQKLSVRVIALTALVSACAMPATASAVATAHLDPPTTTTSGCQPKGIWGIPAPSGTGALSGLQLYQVTAIVGTAETKPCGPQPVVAAGTPTSNSALLQWNAVPGAVGYRIYRATAPAGPYQALIFGAGPPLVETLPPAAVCPPSGTGKRCFFQDNTGTSDSTALAPAAPATNTQAGGHPDVKITERIDYGGVNPDSSPTDPANDDPTTDNPAAVAPPALKTNVFHFPAGLLANPLATRDAAGAVVTCKLSGPAPSLLGDLTKYGSGDPDEDTCPASTLVGTVQAISRAQGGTLTLTQGDIYNGAASASEAGRLFIVLRPLCSAGSPVAPGSGTCVAVLGSAAVQVEKEFLAASSTLVRRADGSYGIDVGTFDIATGVDGPVPAALNVRVSATGTLAGKLTVQVRQLTQTLFGSADQGTAAAADDRAFMTLPTSCSAGQLAADLTTYADLTAFSASAPLTASNCAAVKYAPRITAKLDAVSGTKAKAGPQLDITITQGPDEISTRSAQVTLPKQIGTNLAALARACNETTAGGADKCPATSRIGTATAVTPLAATPLTGPVFIATQASGLPKLIVLLSSGALSLRLDGAIGVVDGTGQIINTFEGIPDVPLSSFSLHITGGKDGLLTNTTELCKGLEGVTGVFTGYDGRTQPASAPITLLGTGCQRRPETSIRLSGLHAGNPLLSVSLHRGLPHGASSIRTVKLTLPKGLTVVSANQLKVATSRKLSRSAYSAKGRLVKVNRLPGPTAKSGRVTLTFAKGALSAGRSLRTQSLKKTLRFGVTVTIATGKTYTYTVRIHSKS